MLKSLRTIVRYEESVRVIQQGVTAAVSACDDGLRPSMGRVLGARFDKDGASITVLLLRSQNPLLVLSATPG